MTVNTIVDTVNIHNIVYNLNYVLDISIILFIRVLFMVDNYIKIKFKPSKVVETIFL